MHAAPPSGGEKPPDQASKIRPTMAYNITKTTPSNYSPVDTNLQFGTAITVPNNHLGSSNINSTNSGPIRVIQIFKEYSPCQILSPNQNLDHSTTKNESSDQLQKYAPAGRGRRYCTLTKPKTMRNDFC